MTGLRREAIVSATAGERTPTMAKVKYRAIHAASESGTASPSVSASPITFREVKRASYRAMAGLFFVIICSIYYAEGTGVVKKAEDDDLACAHVFANRRCLSVAPYRNGFSDRQDADFRP